MHVDLPAFVGLNRKGRYLAPRKGKVTAFSRQIQNSGEGMQRLPVDDLPFRGKYRLCILSVLLTGGSQGLAPLIISAFPNVAPML